MTDTAEIRQGGLQMELFCAPMLTYRKVRSASVLEDHHFRLALANFKLVSEGPWMADMADVTIYTRMMCGYCAAAKRLLDSKGVAYTEHDASFSPALKAEMIAKSNGRSTFPQIFIGQTHVGGSDDLHALDDSGKLNALLATGNPA